MRKLFISIILLLSGVLIATAALTTWKSPDDGEYYFNVKKKLNNHGPKGLGRPFFKKKFEQKSPPKELNIPAKAMVVITGDNVSGSGFVAKMKKRGTKEDLFFIITNIHLVAPNRILRYETIGGQIIKVPNKVYLSSDRDLAMISISPREDYLEVIMESEVKMKPNDEVIVFGNSTDSGALRKLKGKIKKVWPSRFDVDVGFAEKDSGGPIIHVSTERIVGLTSYINMIDDSARRISSFETLEREFEFNKPYRTMLRLDVVSNWSILTQEQLYKQFQLYDDYKSKTDDLIDIILNLRSRRLIRHVDHKQLNRRVNELREDYAWGNHNSSGNLNKYERFKRELVTQIKSDSKMTSKKLVVAYYTELLVKNMKVRESLLPIVEATSLPRNKVMSYRRY